MLILFRVIVPNIPTRREGVNYGLTQEASAGGLDLLHLWKVSPCSPPARSLPAPLLQGEF